MSISGLFARLTRFALASACAMSCAACRKPVPDEMVYTGRASPRTTTGAGGGASTTAARGSDVAFSKTAFLASIADCAQDRYREFAARARTLVEKAGAAVDNANEVNAAAARDAWRGAIASWQEAEVFRFGPAARSTEPGGKDLRDQIYSWPLVNRCGIEEQLVNPTYASGGMASLLINVKGLSAFEYLAFYAGNENVCSQFSTINAHGTWASLAPGDLAQRKAIYAAAVADDVLVHASALVNEWDPARGQFRRELTQAGAGSVTFASEPMALNAVSDALFYIELEAKDWKLGRPLGLLECLEPTCPDAVESLYAWQSTAHLRANLVGFRRIFQGCGDGGQGLGFDDWLRAAGASDLEGRMLAALAAAETALATLDLPLEQAILSEPAKVDAIHAAFKTLTDLLKIEFVTVLNLELPKATVGDND